VPEEVILEEVAVPREQFLSLLELAQDSILISASECSSPPTDKERELMFSAWRLAKIDMPPYLGRLLGWSFDSEVEPDA
jgi:hypothetical protein